MAARTVAVAFHLWQLPERLTPLRPARLSCRPCGHPSGGPRVAVERMLQPGGCTIGSRFTAKLRPELRLGMRPHNESGRSEKRAWWCRSTLCCQDAIPIATQSRWPGKPLQADSAATAAGVSVSLPAGLAVHLGRRLGLGHRDGLLEAVLECGDR